MPGIITSAISKWDIMNKLKTGNKLRILVLDDDSFIQAILSDLLSSSYDISFASDYREFQARLPESKPHILFLDLILPDADGLDICRDLKSDSDYSDMVIFLLTSSTSNETIEAGYLSGADDFIRKPFIPYEIQSKISIFERIIRSRNTLQDANKILKEQNTKLFQLSQLIQKNLAVDDIETCFSKSAIISEILPSGYFELVRSMKERFHTESTVIGDDQFPCTDFNRLIRHVDMDDISEKTKQVRIKTDKGEIHALIAPLYNSTSIFGYILMERRAPFQPEDIKLVSLYSDFFSLIADRNHVESVLKEKNREYEGEISKIRKVQSMTHPDFLDIWDYDISASYLPAHELSGDFFDAYFISGSVFQIILCDVSGHGIASSYIGNEIRTLFRIYSTPERSASELLDMVNRAMIRETSVFYFFCTVIICRFETNTRNLTYANAGHPPALIFKGGVPACEILDKTGPLVGIMEDAEYDEATIEMDKDDCVLLYTDGIIEASDSKKKMYGIERLKEVFSSSQDHSAENIINLIVGSMYEFTRYRDQEDDITAICMKKN